MTEIGGGVGGGGYSQTCYCEATGKLIFQVPAKQSVDT